MPPGPPTGASPSWKDQSSRFLENFFFSSISIFES